MPLKLDSLELAVEALQRSLDAAERHAATEDAALRDTIRAGVIQNFEVAYELSWKFIQRWLRENLSPEDADYPRSRKELFRMAAPRAPYRRPSAVVRFCGGAQSDFAYLRRFESGVRFPDSQAFSAARQSAAGFSGGPE
jgi:hypothetical protein